MTFITELLNKKHDRSCFFCGVQTLDSYLKLQASQDIKRYLSVIFVATDNDNKVTGYYSLSNDSIPKEAFSEEFSRNMPQAYERLPITLLGRLAVSRDNQGYKLGRQLLIDALKRCFLAAKTEIGSMAVVVDPIDESAKNFYKKYGFILLPDRGRMFIPMQTIKSLFED